MISMFGLIDMEICFNAKFISDSIGSLLYPNNIRTKDTPSYKTILTFI